jgi:hypothetical protein
MYEAQKMVKGNSLDTSFPCYWRRVIVLYVLVGSYVCATCCTYAFQSMCWNRWHSNLVSYGNYFGLVRGGWHIYTNLHCTALTHPNCDRIRSDRIGLDWIGSDRIGLDYCATSIDTVPGKSPHIMGILNHHDSKNAFDPRSWTWEPRPWFLDPVLVEQ